DGIRDRTVTGVQTCALPIYDRRTQPHPRAWRQIVRAEIEIDVQLIPRERPAIWRLRHERNGTRVHHVQLHIPMSGTAAAPGTSRSEERRVGKACRSGGARAE